MMRASRAVRIAVDAAIPTGMEAMGGVGLAGLAALGARRRDAPCHGGAAPKSGRREFNAGLPRQRRYGGR